MSAHPASRHLLTFYLVMFVCFLKCYEWPPAVGLESLSLVHELLSGALSLWWNALSLIAAVRGLVLPQLKFPDFVEFPWKLFQLGGVDGGRPGGETRGEESGEELQIGMQNEIKREPSTVKKERKKQKININLIS